MLSSRRRNIFPGNSPGRQELLAGCARQPSWAGGLSPHHQWLRQSNCKSRPPVLLHREIKITPKELFIPGNTILWYVESVLAPQTQPRRRETAANRGNLAVLGEWLDSMT